MEMAHFVLVSRHRSDVAGCAQPSERSARRIAQPIPSVLASDATPRCASMASADRQMIGDATLDASTPSATVLAEPLAPPRCGGCAAAAQGSMCGSSVDDRQCGRGATGAAWLRRAAQSGLVFWYGWCSHGDQAVGSGCDSCSVCGRRRLFVPGHGGPCNARIDLFAARRLAPIDGRSARQGDAGEFLGHQLQHLCGRNARARGYLRQVPHAGFRHPGRGHGQHRPVGPGLGRCAPDTNELSGQQARRGRQELRRRSRFSCAAPVDRAATGAKLSQIALLRQVNQAPVAIKNIAAEDRRRSRHLARKLSWQDLQESAVAPNAALRLSRLPVCAAAASLMVSACIFSACSLNLAGSAQTPGRALVGAPLSGPAPKAGQGSLASWASSAALSCATLASNGIRPVAMAPRRPKCWPITNSALWRYLIASSVLANWAAAGAQKVKAVAARVNAAKAFIGIYFFVGGTRAIFCNAAGVCRFDGGCAAGRSFRVDRAARTVRPYMPRLPNTAHHTAHIMTQHAP